MAKKLDYATASARVNIWQEELNFLRTLRRNISLSLDSVDTKINLTERLIRIEKEAAATLLGPKHSTLKQFRKLKGVIASASPD